MTDAERNPYCSRCGKHLGMPFHETNEHDEARAVQERRGGTSTGRSVPSPV